MKHYLLATVLMAVQVRSSPMPQPQGWGAPPAGWQPPPAGWTAPPAGWTAPPAGWAPPPATPEGVQIATGQTILAQNVSHANNIQDIIFFNGTSSAGEADVLAVTLLHPDSYVFLGMGDSEIPISNYNLGPEATIIGYGYDAAAISVSDAEAVLIETNPQANASSSLGTFGASSWMQVTDGINVAPGTGGSGWKKED